MRLPELERELASSGYLFSRQTGSHRVYRHIATGNTLVLANPQCGHRHEIQGLLLRRIRRTAQQRAQQEKEEAR
jgi:predicted RNA binding protein YcfA (HicA-like mRNA interferase family)